MKRFLTLITSILLLVNIHLSAEPLSDTTVLNKKRFIPLVTGTGLAYAGSMAWLSSTWYDSYSSFHFYNDNHHWLQMDKVGHAYSAFHISQFAVKSLMWSGVEKKKAIWYGGLSGLILLTPIEIFDGFSPNYGASWGDMVANASGSALLLGQYLLWDEPRIQMKFSFHRTPFAATRPEALGGTLAEQALKDYNGQTYWLSINIHSFLPEGNIFPAWLNLSLGYSGTEMQYGTIYESQAVGFNPYRQYFLSLDFDLEHVKTRKKWLKVLAYPLKVIKIPFPAIQFNRHGTSLHPLYF
ncbi:DUF2279 domain-containing protein [Cytophagaceae bacterium ABcell3]|nr:DUF2279 domain-containing protein [Cytophagaceae bacterium ABcell3]